MAKTRSPLDGYDYADRDGRPEARSVVTTTTVERVTERWITVRHRDGRCVDVTWDEVRHAAGPRNSSPELRAEYGRILARAREVMPQVSREDHDGCRHGAWAADSCDRSRVIVQMLDADEVADCRDMADRRLVSEQRLDHVGAEVVREARRRPEGS